MPRSDNRADDSAARPRPVLKPARATPRAAADERIHPPYKIANLVAAAAEEGLDAGALLDGTGLDAAALEDAERKTSSRQFALACRNAIALGASPELPFRMGQRMRVSAYGMYGFALLTFRTAREGMAFAQRFHRLAVPTFRLSLQEDGGVASWVYDDLLGLDPAGELHRFLLEYQIALQASLARDIWPDVIVARRALFRHPQPAHAVLYTQLLNCPVVFGADRDALEFDARLLDIALPLHNPLTATMVHRLCEQALAKAEQPSGLAGRVYQLLAGRPGDLPTMEQVADELHTTARTLRRRLEDEGTTFQGVLNTVRADLAKQYLATTRLTAEEIAGALGFSDGANFRNAFRKWTGRSPTEYRREAQAAG